MCLRYFGIDAYSIIEVKLHEEHGLEVVFLSVWGEVYNMCGNGCRIFVAFAKISGIHAGNDVTFLAGDGFHCGNYDQETREGWVSIKDIPSSNVTKLSATEYVVNTGIAHMVVFADFNVSEIEDINKHGEGLAEKWKQYAKGYADLIVNFVYEKDGILFSRCCDKNVGREIVACGTATAAIGKYFFWVLLRLENQI